MEQNPLLIHAPQSFEFQKENSVLPNEFNPKNFLDSIRQSATSNAQNLTGEPAKIHKPLLDKILDEARMLSAHQFDQLGKFTIGIVDVEKNKEAYAKHFINSTRGLAIATFRLSEKNIPSISTEPLYDDIKRSLILRQLARDFRRISWTLSDQEISKVGPSSHKVSLPHIHNPEQIVRILEEHGDIGLTGIKRGISSDRYNTSAFLYSRKTEQVRLTKDPRFVGVPSGVIKKALQGYTENPEKYLLDFKEDLKTYLGDKKYLELGRGVIINVVSNYRLKTKERFDAIIRQRELLTKDPGFNEDFSKAFLNRVAFLHPYTAKEFLLTVQERVKKFTQEPKYSDLPRYAITRAVVYSSKNPEKFLDKIVVDLHSYLDDPKYSVLGKTNILFCLLNSPKKAKTNFDTALLNMHAIKKDPKYEIFDFSIITRSTTAMFSERYKDFLNKALSSYKKLRSDPSLSTMEDHLIARSVIMHPRRTKAYLVKAFSLSQEIQKETPFSKVSPKKIRNATVLSPKDPREYILKSTRKKLYGFAKRYYPDFTKEELDHISKTDASSNLSSLKMIKTKIDQTSNDPRHSKMNYDFIKHIVVLSFHPSEDVMDDQLKKTDLNIIIDRKTLDERFESIPARTIIDAFMMYPPKIAEKLLLHLEAKTRAK